ncbi:hypothetical protein BN1326_150291 [Staphylococcus argenteus]|uniref:Uncharacterized protein n=1 Tax=Staphylococcus argenteus TaxID=985002 RepID=A0A7U7JS57_9STAP|nr:hypothetical protein BN1326_150291 [Staphylococcus argenteus]CRI19094.1 hypothetical protein BN1326_150291 [Staphylococcus argenteus]
MLKVVNSIVSYLSVKHFTIVANECQAFKISTNMSLIKGLECVV